MPVLEGVRIGLNTPDFVVARTGTALYVTGEASVGGAPVQAVWVTRGGVSSPIDTSWSWPQLASSNGLSLSPDGRQLAVSISESSGQNIWVKQLDAGPLTRLTFEPRTIRPVWSANGRYLWYGANDSTGLRLLQRRADGTSSPETILDPTGDVEEVVETRDTTVMIVRLTVPGGGRQIFLFRRAAGTGDSALTPLLAAPGYDQMSPALSPDGRWLAYTSRESGRNEVYVRPFPDVDAGRWQVSRNGGIEPMWSHNGRELPLSQSVAPGGRGGAHPLGGRHRLPDGGATDTLRRPVFPRPVSRAVCRRRRTIAGSFSSASRAMDPSPARPPLPSRSWCSTGWPNSTSTDRAGGRGDARPSAEAGSRRMSLKRHVQSSPVGHFRDTSRAAALAARMK